MKKEEKNTSEMPSQVIFWGEDNKWVTRETSRDINT